MRRIVLDRRRRFRIAIALAVGISAGAIAWGVSAAAGPSHEPAAFARHGILKVSRVRNLSAKGQSRDVLVAGDLVREHGAKRIHLGGGDELIAAVTGSLVPLAVETGDGSLAVYSSWHQIAQIRQNEPGQGLRAGDPIGIPSVRLYDASSGKDILIAIGGYAPALSSDGELAFAKGVDRLVRENVDYVSQILVGDARRRSFVRWTSEAARYFPYAWAGHSLLAYRAIPDSEATDLYVFTGPQASRLLAADATVVAVSPDGTRALITAGRRMVEVVRISDGAVESSLALDGPGVAEPGSTSTPHALMYSGSWFGDRVVANSDAGLVVLNVKGGLRIESIFQTPFPHGILEPVFADETHVLGWADLTTVPTGTDAEPGYTQALVTCDLAALSCTAGPQQPPREWTRWIANPSRP